MTRGLFVLALAIFATMLGNGVVMPFIPLYSQQFGAEGFTIGVLFGSHSASRTFLLPFIGRASDRRGRKEFLLWGLALYAASSVAFLLANSLFVLTLVMALQGVATAMVQPISMAYVGDLTPKGQEGRYSGYINTAFLGGVAGGPVLGGVVRDLYNMQASFILLGILSLLALILLWLFLPEVRHEKNTQTTTHLPLREIFSCYPLVGMSVFRLSYAAANAAIWVFVPLLAAQLLALSTSQIGLLISLNVLVSTVMQAPCGRLADRVTNKVTLIVIGGLVSAVSLALFPLATTYWHLVVLNLLVGAAFGLAYPAHMAVAMENAKGFGMGTVMSLLLTVHSFAMTVGPMLFGLVIDLYSLNGVFYSGGLFGLLVTIACYVLSVLPVTTAEPAADKEPLVAD
jgi:MFS family permease